MPGDSDDAKIRLYCWLSSVFTCPIAVFVLRETAEHSDHRKFAIADSKRKNTEASDRGKGEKRRKKRRTGPRGVKAARPHAPRQSPQRACGCSPCARLAEPQPNPAKQGAAASPVTIWRSCFRKRTFCQDLFFNPHGPIPGSDLHSCLQSSG